MKGLIAFLLVGLIALAGYNFWEIHTLRQEVGALELKMEKQKSENDLSDAAIAKAMTAYADARDALSKVDTQKARAAFDTAKRNLDDAGRMASDKAGPTIKWLRDQANDLGRQLQEKTEKK